MQNISYNELYRRNWPIISKNLQTKVSELKVAVAGYGSTGGAFIDGLMRLGVQHFHLCDNGSYELNNLNRQMVSLQDLDVNKSTAHKSRILSVNPNAQVHNWETGVTNENLDAFLDGIDFLFDAVDVTTAHGMSMKLALHKAAHKKGLPTGSALDLGYTQWLESYNYHQGEELLKGRYEMALACKHPLKALIEGFSSVDELPLEIAVELLRLIKNPSESACQLACVCFVLSGMVTPYMLHFLNKGRLPNLTTIDLMSYFEDQNELRERENHTKEIRHQLKLELENIA